MKQQSKDIHLIGLPVQHGASGLGCALGPGALRVAGLSKTLADLGHSVTDMGDITPQPYDCHHGNPALHDLDICTSWIAGTHAQPVPRGVPVYLGGDHLMAACTVPMMAQRAAQAGRALHVLWLDAHSDFHTLDTTTSGNLHGTPAAYFTGQPGFDAFPPLPERVHAADVLMVGLRSVDTAERARTQDAGVQLADMRRVDEVGIATCIASFIARAKAENADVHLSFDVDFLDPSIAPAVGTTVPGGATFREAHLIMEHLCDADIITSVDIAEINPMLDHRGATTHLMVDLIASLFGKTVLDRPNS